MNFSETGIIKEQKTEIKNLLPEIGIEKIRKEIIQGLTANMKYISSKFFYDKKGSELFEKITNLEEYYPTRTEKNILNEIVPELVNGHSSFEIVELGSGDCSKISIFFDSVKDWHLRTCCYIPVDVSKSAIENAADELSKRFPELKINGYVADFMKQTQQIPRFEKSRLICFLGSTIGNFSQNESQKILKNISESLDDNDAILIGFDLVKPEHLLNAAYNDSKGITAAFNKNILNVVNGMIKSDFREEDFEHFSYFNTSKSRIEMHLVANKDCRISSPFYKKTIEFQCGEKIHTENSHKFSMNDIEMLAENTSLKVERVYTDPNKWFALVLFERA